MFLDLGTRAHRYKGGSLDTSDLPVSWIKVRTASRPFHAMNTKSTPTFDKAKHVKFWKRCSTLLPQDYQSSDASRLSLGFFIVAALDLLGVLETEISASERQGWIDWIYSCQVHTGGFRGFPGTNLGAHRNYWNLHWDPASLPSTYLALLTLLILGDDLVRIRRVECLAWLRRLQKANGSFADFESEDGELVGKDDLRMCYCAVGTAYILQTGLEGDERPPFDDSALIRFITNCQGHDGGFGQSPTLEAHSGLNFCAIATLGCLDRRKGKSSDGKTALDSTSIPIGRNIDWMLQRQTTWVDEDDSSDEEDGSNETDHADHKGVDGAESGLRDGSTVTAMGFNGRLGKMADTCYCFWNAGALAILNQQSLIDIEALRQYLCGKAQHLIGGFSKAPGAPPDVMHSYLGLAALAVYKEPGLKELDPVLAVSIDAAKRLEKVAWKGKRER